MGPWTRVAVCLVVMLSTQHDIGVEASKRTRSSSPRRTTSSTTRRRTATQSRRRSGTSKGREGDEDEWEWEWEWFFIIAALGLVAFHRFHDKKQIRSGYYGGGGDNGNALPRMEDGRVYCNSKLCRRQQPLLWSAARKDGEYAGGGREFTGDDMCDYCAHRGVSDDRNRHCGTYECSACKDGACKSCYQTALQATPFSTPERTLHCSTSKSRRRR